MKLSDLRKPLPSERISYREQDGRSIAYIAWHDAADLLDEACPDYEIDGPYSQNIISVQNIENRIVVVMQMQIPLTTGKDEDREHRWVERQAVGFEYLIDPKTGKEISYGDAFSNASSMAFRRCCAMFGIGRELYKKKADNAPPRSRGEFEAADRRDVSRTRSEGPSSPEATAAGEFAKNPKPSSPEYLASEKQLALIEQLASAKGLDAQHQCQLIYKCGLDEIGKKAASALIDHLKA